MLIEIFQLDNGDQSYLLVPKNLGISEDAKRLSDLSKEELCLLKATPRVSVRLAPGSFADSWGCEPHEDFYGEWGSRQFGLKFDEEGFLTSHQTIGVHRHTNTFEQYRYDYRSIWADAATDPVTFPRQVDCETSYYEQSTLGGVHSELNRQLGWFTLDHGWECSACGAPWGPLCECCFDPEGELLPAREIPEGQPKEFFEVNISQLFAGYVDKFPPNTRVRVYPREGEIEVKTE